MSAAAALVFAAAVQLPAPPAPGSYAPPPSPPLHPRIVEQPDPTRFYPRKERKAGTGGVVEIGLILRYDGRPSQCQVKTGSGSPALDSAACRLGRALRFAPAEGSPARPNLEFGCCAWVEVDWKGGTARVRGVVPERPPEILNRTRLIGAEDYPAAALRAGEQGVVEAELAVDAQGRVTGCTILRSSGSSALDSTSCRLALIRATIRPASDRYGQPVTGTVKFRPAWRIEPDAPPRTAQ